MKNSFFALMLVLLSCSAMAQGKKAQVRDTIFMREPDTTLVKTYAKRFSPRKALLYAAVAPGLGQVYNKKYWKLPLVYGGAYLIGREINKYNGFRTEYKRHLFYNLENNLSDPTDLNPNANLTTSQLRRIVDRAQRERDFMVILMGGLYLLQIVDAHVDAHLKEFDLNPDLKRKVTFEPMVTQDAMIGRQTGMAVIFRF